MTKLLIILILIIFYLIFRGEMFENMEYVKTPWAYYSAADGSYLNYITREHISWVEYSINSGVFAVWGFSGKGNPDNEVHWELLVYTRGGKKKVDLPKYKAYKILIDFNQ